MKNPSKITGTSNIVNDLKTKLDLVVRVSDILSINIRYIVDF